MRLYVFALITALLVPISASAQTDAECAAIHDWNGTRVGRVQHADTGGARVLFDDGGRIAMVTFDRNSTRSIGEVFFTGGNCTGDMFMYSQGLVAIEAHVVGSDVWYPDLSAAPVLIQMESKYLSDGRCSEGSFAIGGVLPAYTFTLPTFTPPFHLEPEACFTPPDPEQVINGCITKNGTLKIVADPTDCSPRETPITLLSP